MYYYTCVTRKAFSQDKALFYEKALAFDHSLSLVKDYVWRFWRYSMSDLKLRPLNDRLIVEPLEMEETFAGGQLVIPETAKEKPQQGMVLAVGPGAKDDDGDRIAMDVEVEDRVLFAKYAGTEITLDGGKYLILRESDVLAIIE
jgi:chaperonin GroES